ncbi:divergent polysaccharide deacetylase family protein [Neptuniibacter marinus]|mgnify:CR=1 FL=1|uniref:divergent polysaccharide deacetylase family protein n=1 Tax=Neptuniibacter marinus TaxID=1806670 RepID=UPI0008373F07|nr:divergent polysaccharide deacetylase family protein [Neptuniibacter marinus]
MMGFVNKLLLLFLLASPIGLVSNVVANQAFTNEDPVMVIIIDDIGDNKEKGLAAIKLPGVITYAFLPHTPYSFELAQTAYGLGKEVILHAPMENKAGLRLGPGALTQQHSLQQVNQILNEDLDSIPHVVGMNNHMGSLLTEDRQRMDIVMSVIRERNMFFIDSLTTPNTVAWQLAHEYKIPYLIRDVFLDNQPHRAYIHNQFKQALSLAVTQGHAVVIGHPYPETIAYLSEVIPILAELNIKLVSASELLSLRSQTRLMISPPKVDQPCDSKEGHCVSMPVAIKH